MTTPFPNPPQPGHQPCVAAPQQTYGHGGHPGPQYPPPPPWSGQHPIPPQQARPPGPPHKRRFGPGAWLGTIAGAVVVIVVIISAVASTGSASPATATPATSASASATVAAPTPAAAAPTVAVAPPAPAKAITARDWAKIAKNPDAHVGEAVIVYGKVTQFDSATGTTTFRANVDGVKHAVSYGYADYETNTVLAATGADVSDLVQGDLFKAETVVTGSISYETTMGGTLTAPQLGVVRITVIGTSK